VGSGGVVGGWRADVAALASALPRKKAMRVSWTGGQAKASGTRVPADREVEALDRSRYAGFTAKHFHEPLVRDHQFVWGYTWTKTLLHSKGLALERVPIKWNHVIDKDAAQNQRVGACRNRKSRATFLRTCFSGRSGAGCIAASGRAGRCLA
jgi:hypothetical protein